MRHLDGVDTQRFNRRRGRVGHGFQGRFKAAPAGMARRARDWRWSGFRATAGLAGAPAWLDDDWLLARFARRRASGASSHPLVTRRA